MRPFVAVAALLVLASCGSPTSVTPGSATSGSAQLLTVEEAVDLARFRSWHSPEGVITGVPQAHEVFAATLPWSDARAFLERVDPTVLFAFEHVPAARKDKPSAPHPSSQVFLVVVRGPVASDRGKVVANSLGFVVDRQANALYRGIGGQWDTAMPPHAQAMPIRDAPSLRGVSLARAQGEIGGVPLVQPEKLPIGLALTQININPSGESVDPSGATFPYRSVTLVYTDPTTRARLWFSQTIFLYKPGLTARATPFSIGQVRGQRYESQRDGSRLLTFAWERGDRSLYLSAELGPDLTEEAVLTTAASIVVNGPQPQVPSAASAGG